MMLNICGTMLAVVMGASEHCPSRLHDDQDDKAAQKAAQRVREKAERDEKVAKKKRDKAQLEEKKAAQAAQKAQAAAERRQRKEDVMEAVQEAFQLPEIMDAFVQQLRPALEGNIRGSGLVKQGRTGPNAKRR